MENLIADTYDSQGWMRVAIYSVRGECPFMVVFYNRLLSKKTQAFYKDIHEALEIYQKYVADFVLHVYLDRTNWLEKERS